MFSVRPPVNYINRIFGKRVDTFIKSACGCFHTCIVGSGPSGFYVANYLLKNDSNIKVDIFEKLPVPYGLIRYGVAPDHQEVKNVIKIYETIATNPRFSLFSNINIGQDITLNNLLEYYDAVVLCYGRSNVKRMKINGENLPNVFSGSEIVGWYNGHPSYANLKPDFSGKTGLIIGNGNVALDIARIILSPLDTLGVTDITSYAMQSLSNSKIKKVDIIGRRSCYDVSFTTKELRAVKKMKNASVCLNEKIEEPHPTNLNSPKKRLLELIESLPYIDNSKSSETNLCCFSFHREPVNIRMNPNDNGQPNLIITVRDPRTGATSEMKTDIIIHCIGYEGECIDPILVPFNNSTSTIINEKGRVIINNNNNIQTKLYCAGWIKSGSKGVIIDTMANAYETAASLLDDKKCYDLKHEKNNNKLNEFIQQKNLTPLSFGQWKLIDLEECKRGLKSNKIREKITDVEEMIKIATDS